MLRESFFWGFVAASSLIIGAVLAIRIRISTRTIGLIMAFGSGVLISAVAFDLVAEAIATVPPGHKSVPCEASLNASVIGSPTPPVAGL